MPNETLVSLDLPDLTKLRSGKVREVFDLGETLLFIATDRLSAFDVILPDPIPEKGAVLNQISAFWFEKFSSVRNHFITTDFALFPAQLRPHRTQLEDHDRKNQAAACRVRYCVVIWLVRLEGLPGKR
jgi:phosphoribosylaminoimidazole-succinocarboxamide synthase